jgi:AraC-like DNA-binding protein
LYENDNIKIGLSLSMEFPIVFPCDALKPYVKYYWVCESDTYVAREAMYPTGHIEFCIDISNGNTVRHFDGRSVKMPSMEVLGHLTGPTSATVAKGTTVLVTRFYPYTSSLFFPTQASDFTNDSIDLYDIVDVASTEFYERLMEQRSIEQKIKVLESFLIQQLVRNRKSQDKLKLVESICNHVYRENEPFSIENLSAHYGFSKRYIQRLFLEWVGLTPRSFFSVQRFNKSLDLIRTSTAPLTSIAFDCGYYDQAHFIREFKSYTGSTPTQVMELEVR